MNNKYLTCASLTVIIVSCVFATSAEAVSLPVLSTFDTDTIGLSPATGGDNQPSDIFYIDEPNDPNDASTLLVQSQSNGIDTQPIVATIYEPVGGEPYPHAAMAEYSFSTITDGTIRIESTVSFDQVDYAFFFYALNSDGHAITSMHANYLGEIFINESVSMGTTIGANSPFRFRMDVDLTDQIWSVSIDDELDGFADDLVMSGTQFVSGETPRLVDIATARFGAERGFILSQYGLTLNVAHDNIYIGAVPIPASFLLFGSGLLGLVGIARRKNAA